ncbi:GGDEF domain-containing protein [Halomonas sp. M20]|uniref:GGDEF domain-containing protein n=1 Tax=Halomonas sp. M20 TaxID=2763264 RepID=UPI001D0AF2C5|nr:GGDEF domain-containing protein [Halomonas sp. M20]
MLSHQLSQSLERSVRLPSLPTVVLRVVELARDSNVNLQDIIDNLGRDPALSARLLSLANTVFYAQHKPAEDLTQAVSRIGLERTLSLALGCSLVASTKKQGVGGFNLERYWQRSLICALCAKSLAESLNLSGEGGALFTASLLQDIGMLAMRAVDEERYLGLLVDANTHSELVALERRVYDSDHAEVGAWLAERWQLSERTLNWIRSSHDELVKTTSREQQITNCIIAASMLADAWIEGEASLGSVMITLEDYFDIETTELLASIMTLQEQLPLLASLYDIAVPERLDSNQLMLEAKQVLSDKNESLQRDIDRQREEIELLRQQQQALSLQAKIDPLTQVYNRTHLAELLSSSFDAKDEKFQPLAIIFMDLDHFKSINDRFGHVIGDAVLKNFASTLRDMAGEVGGQVGRYGGEEFVVVLPNNDEENATLFAENVRERLQKTALGGSRKTDIHITVSFGIAAIQAGDEFRDVESLFDAADSSMYESKRAGRDRITVFSSKDDCVSS